MEQNEQTTQSFWDRPVLGKVKLSWRTAVLGLLVLLLLFSRLWDLGNRSFGHDESIHAWSSWQLVTGQRYIHDPVYHGPVLYHTVALMYLLFGINDVAARIAPALLGIASVLLVLGLRRWMGRAGAWFAILLLTISPTMMIRSRYLRHDIWLIVAAMVMAICFFRYLEDRRERWLIILATALVIAFCSISGAYIYGAIFGSFWLLYLAVEWWGSRRPLKEYPVFDLVVLMATLALPLATAAVAQVLKINPLDYSDAGLIRTGTVFLVLLAISAAVGIWWNRRVWLISAGIFYAIFLLLYTSLFTNGRGAATGMVGMLGYWLSQQTVRRGGQPWYYFYWLEIVYEYLPTLLSLMGIGYFLAKLGRRRKAAPVSERPSKETVPTAMSERLMPIFLIYWLLTQFVIWTWVGEKMPWQNLHLALPLCMVGGWFLGQVWERTDWARLRGGGRGWLLVWLPVAVFSLVMVFFALGAKPFGGMSLEQLQVTLRFLVALVTLGIAIAFLWRYGRGLGVRLWARIALATVVVFLAVLTLRAALMASFINQDYATEFIVYADSTPDTNAVMRELDAMSARLSGDKELKIAYDDESSWPFVWLLRDYKNNSFFGGSGTVASDAQVVLVGAANESKIKGQLGTKYYRRNYRLIWWPNQDIYSNLTPSKIIADLRDPARRQYWWDIWWARKYPQSTTSWPYVHTFAMFVRKDIAAQLWNYGPEVAGPTVEMPEDEYEKKRVTVAAVSVVGSYGQADGQFNYPKGIAADSQGRLLVADSVNHRVQVFDASGRFLFKIGGQGNQAGQFQEPWAVAADAAGNIYVADTWNHRIQKFDSQGKFLTMWGAFGDTQGALGGNSVFYGPRDIKVDKDGNVLVSDTGNKRVLKYSPEGAFITQVGGAGTLQGQFREPVGLAVDREGNVYVADTWNQRVQKLDANLTALTSWAVLGWESEGVINKPYIAADSQGFLYATEPEYHRVIKLDQTGKVAALWGNFGSDTSSFNMPVGIAIDAQDNVYVCDSANHRVLKFAPIK